ncbi:MAG: hypothetical protein MUP71_02185 [Candidatus Aminicenantes bacterium]|nr:hypothetical protein [Candidatus Aminicenantes bacterium]
MNRKLQVIAVFNLSAALGIVLLYSKLPYVSQFAALTLIFLFPAAGLVLFSQSNGLLKIVRGFVYSTVISMAVFAISVFISMPLRQPSYLAALLLLGNFFLIFNLVRKKEIVFEKKDKHFYLFATMVIFVAGGLSFWGAVRVVPVLQDHDAVMECPAYGLAKTLKPYCIETRVPFYLAKGPTSHFIYAFPLVLTDNLERVKHYYDTSLAALNLPDFKKNIVRMWHAEFMRWFPRQADRVILETRTTSIFISIMLALLLFAIIAEIVHSHSLAFTLSLIFLTLPEIFVRNSYAGYQNISNLFLLLAIYHFIRNREDWLTPLLLATVNQKCVIILGLAVGFWLLHQKTNFKKILLNKTLIGLVIGMLLLYAYGFLIHPQSLLEDQFQRHGIDRLLHQNPIPGMNYPSIGGLWAMFAFNYGAFFIVLFLASSMLMFKNRQAFPREMVLLFIVVSTALVFSLVDWRMTKHLDLMIPAMMLISAYGFRDHCWQVHGKYRGAVLTVIALVLINNAWIIAKLAQDFNWLKVTPIW